MTKNIKNNNNKNHAIPEIRARDTWFTVHQDIHHAMEANVIYR